MKNSQLFAILFAIMCSPRMSTPFALGSAGVYLVMMFVAMWREA
ncbi:hypothetical protein SAMN05443245_5226 [Paraburkholderia fungorum]|uniref:Uncharacterized protein n=1 Tax=Paraburkholderia fungorum TaxID=134537 RepID=A0A1H1IID2_9BURK|nr:hypothetical protein SAMN05443245_5226 [Paraburkholderia fungorum]